MAKKVDPAKKREYNQRAYWKVQIDKKLVDKDLKNQLKEKLKESTKESQFGQFKDFFEAMRTLQKPAVDKVALADAFDQMEEILDNLNVTTSLEDKTGGIDVVGRDPEEAEFERVYMSVPSGLAKRLQQIRMTQGIQEAIQLAHVLGY